ncbi:MAG: hypothetical protein KQH63_14765 [Desulfobulbaceae bacterium]|nr:hypothetical protein [Desulfobulbaceae bacterium]
MEYAPFQLKEGDDFLTQIVHDLSVNDIEQEISEYYDSAVSVASTVSVQIGDLVLSETDDLLYPSYGPVVLLDETNEIFSIDFFVAEFSGGEFDNIFFETFTDPGQFSLVQYNADGSLEIIAEGNFNFPGMVPPPSTIDTNDTTSAFAAEAMAVTLAEPQTLEALTPIESVKYPFNVINLGTLAGDRVMAADLNNLNQVVGYTYETYYGFVPKAVFWENGQLSQIDGDDHEAYGINDNGQIVGSAPNFFPDDNRRAVLWSASEPRIPYYLPQAPAHEDCYGYKINNDGDIIGKFYNTNNQSQNLIWSKLYPWVDDYAAPVVITVNGETSTFMAQDINNQKQVVGDNLPGAFMWENGSGWDIFTGVPQSSAKAI